MPVEITDFHSAILPVHIICKILGITPYSVVGPPKCHKLIVTKQDLFINIVQYISFIGCYCYLSANNLWLINWNNLVDRVTGLAQHYSFVVLTVSSLIFFHIHRKQILNLFTCLTNIDKELRQMNIVVDYRVVRRFCLVQTGIRLLLFISMVLCHLPTLQLGVSLLVTIFYNTVLVITLMNPCYMATIVFDISYKYSLFNSKLQHIFSSEPKKWKYEKLSDSRTLSSSERNHIDILKKLMNIHGRLYDLCKTLNSMYNIQIVLLLLSSFIATVVTCYDIQNYLNEHEIHISLLSNMLIWTLYNIAQLVFLVQNLESCCAQANNTVTVLNNIRYNIFNSELSDRISTILLLLNHHKLEFTAYGLFPLNYNLLYTMLAAVTTYMIILYQFKNNS